MHTHTKTIAFINGKGGTGKSTTCVLVAAALATVGREVQVLDLDTTQRTATSWLDSSGLGHMVANGHFSTGEVRLIDTPPRLDSTLFQKAASMASIIILVTSPSPADLVTTQQTILALNLIAEATGATPTVRLLYNNVQQGTSLSQDLPLRAREIGAEPLLQFIRRRQAYQHSIIMGWKKLPAVAREEVLAVALEIATLPEKMLARRKP
jgi:chromosome partitioning protein